MYSVIVGSSPQTGQAGSRRRVTSVNEAASASYSSSRPTSASPIPSASLRASVAWIDPTTPGSTPRTPPSAQLGASSGGGGVGKRQREHGPSLGLKTVTWPSNRKIEPWTRG